MNLFQRINEVRKAIPYVQKDKDVSTGGGSYRAVTHDTVTAMVRPAMIGHGIVCVPNLIDSQSMPFEVWEVDGKTARAKQFRYEATYDFTFFNVEDPKDYVTIRIQAHAMDNADKAPGKALSYAKKYAILKLFEIETGEDDESRFRDDSADKLDEDDVKTWITAIQKTTTKDAAKDVFQKAVADCKQAGDLDAAGRIKLALVEHGKTLDKEPANG